MAVQEPGSTQLGDSDPEQGPTLKTLVKAGVIKVGNGLYVETGRLGKPQWGIIQTVDDPSTMLFLKSNLKSDVLQCIYIDDVTGFILFEAIAFSDGRLPITSGAK